MALDSPFSLSKYFSKEDFFQSIVEQTNLHSTPQTSTIYWHRLHVPNKYAESMIFVKYTKSTKYNAYK